MEQWHNADKKLPPPMKDVLGIKEYDYNGKHYRYYVITYVSETGKWYIPTNWPDKITWWMELPEMPEPIDYFRAGKQFDYSTFTEPATIPQSRQQSQPAAEGAAPPGVGEPAGSV